MTTEPFFVSKLVCERDCFRHFWAGFMVGGCFVVFPLAVLMYVFG